MLPESFAQLSCFGNLSSQQAFVLHGCPSLQEPPASLGALSSLEELIIQNCGLERLPDNFGQLKALKRLIIESSNLKALPSSFGNLASLQVLSLRKSRSLQELPASLGALSSLEKWNLESCGLETLPYNFGQLKALKKLIIEDSNLRVLPSSFGNLSSLQILSLRRIPSLQKLPASLGALSSLEELTIESCGLGRLPDNFGELKALKKLIIEDSDLKALRNSFGNLSSLQGFWRYGCPSLRELPASFGALSSLEELTLENCGLERLPDNFGKLTALKRLSLDIREPDDLVQFCDTIGLWSALEILELTLDGSKFKRLPDNFGVLTMLTKLTISNADCLVELPDDVGRVSSLRHLLLIECKKLKSLPDSLGNPLSPQLAPPRGDRVSPSAATSERRKAPNAKALPCLLYEGVSCGGSDMFPTEGTLIKSTKEDDYDWCSSWFEKADDQADYVRTSSNSLRLEIHHCPFLEELEPASLGWVKETGSLGKYMKLA